MAQVREAKLRWFGYVQRDSGYTGQRMLKVELPGRRRGGRSQQRRSMLKME